MAVGRGSCTARVLNWFYKFIAWSPPRHPRGTAGKGSSGFLEKGNSRLAARYRDRNGKIYVRRDRPPISVRAEKDSIAVTLHGIHPLF